MKRLEDVKESKPITLISQQIKLQIFTFTILLYLIGQALELTSIQSFNLAQWIVLSDIRRSPRLNCWSPQDDTNSSVNRALGKWASFKSPSSIAVFVSAVLLPPSSPLVLQRDPAEQEARRATQANDKRTTQQWWDFLQDLIPGIMSVPHYEAFSHRNPLIQAKLSLKRRPQVGAQSTTNKPGLESSSAFFFLSSFFFLFSCDNKFSIWWLHQV